MRKFSSFLTIIALLLGFNTAKAQFKMTKELMLALNPAAGGMNFLVGKDAALFETTGKVFGSGVLDFSGVYPVLPYWIQMPKKTFGYAVPFGIRIAKYRFTKHLYFEKTPAGINVLEDTNPTHSFNNSFFSYDGSKLVTGFVHIPFVFTVNITDQLSVFGSLFYDRYLFAYHKLRYKSGSEKQVDKIKNANFKDFYFNKNKAGITLGIKYGAFGIGGSYVPTPMFIAGKGPELHELRLGIIYESRKK